MTKRKLDIKRLNKLAIIAVIVFTLGSIFLSLWWKTELNSKHDELIKTCSGVSGQSGKNLCIEHYSKQISVLQKKFKFSFIAAWLLPTLFFGGTWVFRYLFPKQIKG
ncbi:MAG TPA: hypothetical protein VJ242_04420 [Patescibacteria group bacterium]|nr:MAG: hypothetical protein A2959_04055 [Candidatus Levybacteria bacterium RIFCSPLOWO2_01_FULL_38_23]HKZ35923.1 hypothetical protein [Patescibacteria group bacterium]